MSKKDNNITYQKGKLFPNLDFQNLNKEIETVADKNYKPPPLKKPIQQKYTMNPSLIKEIKEIKDLNQNQTQQTNQNPTQQPQNKKMALKRLNTNITPNFSSNKTTYLNNYLNANLKNSPINENTFRLDSSNNSFELRNKNKDPNEVSNASPKDVSESRTENEEKSPKHQRQDSRKTKFATINLEKVDNNFNLTNNENSQMDSPVKAYNFRMLDENTLDENKGNAGLTTSLLATNNSQRGDIELEKLLSLEERSKNEWKNNRFFDKVEISNSNYLEFLGKQIIINQILELDHFSLEGIKPVENKIVNSVDILVNASRKRYKNVVQNQNCFEISKLEKKKNTIQNIFYFDIFQEKNLNFESCSDIQFNYMKDKSFVLLNRTRRFLQHNNLDKCIDLSLTKTKESSFNKLLVSEASFIDILTENKKDILNVDSIDISYYPPHNYKQNEFTKSNVTEKVSVEFIHEKKRTVITPENNKNFELLSSKKIIPNCLEWINNINILSEDRKKEYSVTFQEVFNITQRQSSFKEIIFENSVQSLFFTSKPKEPNKVDNNVNFKLEGKKKLDFGIEKSTFNIKSPLKASNTVFNSSCFSIPMTVKKKLYGIESVQISIEKDKNRHKSYLCKNENRFCIDSTKKVFKFSIENNINSIKFLPSAPSKFKNLTSSISLNINYDPILKHIPNIIEKSSFSLFECKNAIQDQYKYMKKYPNGYLRNEAVQHFTVTKIDKAKYFIKKTVIHTLPLREEIIIHFTEHGEKHLSYEEFYRSGLIKHKEKEEKEKTGEEELELNRAMSRNDRDIISQQLKLNSLHQIKEWGEGFEDNFEKRQLKGNTLLCLHRKNSDIKELFTREQEEKNRPITDRNYKRSFKVGNKKWSDEENAVIEVKSNNNNIFTFNNFQRVDDMPKYDYLKGSKNGENKNESDVSNKPRNLVNRLGEGKIIREEIVMGVNKKRHLNEYYNLNRSGSNLENNDEKSRSLNRIANIKERLSKVASSKNDGKVVQVSYANRKENYEDLVDSEENLEDKVFPTAESMLEKSNNDGIPLQRVFSDKTKQTTYHSIISKPFSSKLVNSYERNVNNDVDEKLNTNGKLIKGNQVDNSRMYWDEIENFQSNFSNFQTSLKALSSIKSNLVSKKSSVLNIDISTLEKNLNKKGGKKDNFYFSDNHLTKNIYNSSPPSKYIEEVQEKYKESSIKNLKRMLEEDKSTESKSFLNSKYPRIDSSRKRIVDIDLSSSNIEEVNIKKGRFGRDLIHPPNLLNIFNKINK